MHAGRQPGEDPLEVYERIGRLVREELESLLPEDWSWRDKRVLDFGCGSGRVLRQFLDEAQEAEFWGCDTHGPSVEWVQENLCPPLHCFRNDFEPGLPLEDGHFDLVLATSVFTHIPHIWADWLLELHRILSSDGLLVSTHMAEQNWEAVLKEPYDEDRAGLTVMPETAPGYVDGPGIVFHSDWWLREHWGRAFEILEIDHPQAPSDGGEPLEQNFLLARKREVNLTAEELERLNPNESRELESLRTNVRVLLRESRTLNRAVRLMERNSGHLRRRINQLEAGRDRLLRRLDQVEPRTGQPQLRLPEARARLHRQQLMLRQISNSRSWRLTAPLRTLAAWARKLRARTSRAQQRP
jgi:SAM-dependent methyltransferase